jgi:hypothetical protein
MPFKSNNYTLTPQTYQIIQLLQYETFNNEINKSRQNYAK